MDLQDVKLLKSTDLFNDVKPVDFTKDPMYQDPLLAYQFLFLNKIKTLNVGSGARVMRADQDGFWLGAEHFADAPFKVTMDGDVYAANITLTGYIPEGGAAADVNAGVTEVNGGQLVDGSVGNNQLGSGAVTAAKIAALTITAAEIAAGAITAAKISVSQLSAIAADIGTITAGTIQGVTFRTAASGVRVEMTASQARITFYDSGGDNVLEIDENGTDALVDAGDGRHLALSGASTKRVYINSDLDLNSNEIWSVDQIRFINRSSHVSNNNTIWVKDGNFFFRSNGGTLTQLN